MKGLDWIEISKSAVKNNIQTIRKLIGKKTILAPCIKANAYGHGLAGMAKLLLKNGADWLCINYIEEAESLRRAGFNCPVLIIGYVQLGDLGRIIKTKARLFVYNKETIDKLNRLAGQAKTKAKIHIKVDTGMSRQGIRLENLDEFIKYTLSKKNILIEGVATHYASADELNSKIFQKQKNRFNKLYKKYKNEIKYWHASNSAAILLGENNNFNLVRPGISIYGYYPSDEVAKVCQRRKISLKPVLNLKTKVAQIKTINKGDIVSYGATWKAKQKTKIAVLPIGYYDGIFRILSNRMEVLIHGKRAKVIGRICMNIMIVDISHIKNVKLEDEVVIIGRQGKEEIKVEELADKAHTINYEITTQLRGNLPRYYI